jgi:hydrogenase expression/formation protein HypD
VKFVDEFRDPQKMRALADALAKLVTRPVVLMELCGGQTHSILRYGIDQLLPRAIELVHGPGCPVCVTPLAAIDRAIDLASRPRTIFCSFGDMLRVPGTRGDLFSARARGADVRVVYSPMDALELAAKTPDREVVFFAIGFETTAPANAMAVYQASLRGVSNFSVLVSHALVPPAMEAILGSPDNRVQGFLAAGHVCTIMGHEEYEPIAARYRVPIVVTGFEPLDLLEGIYLCVQQFERGEAKVENQYARSASREGNRPALALLQRVFRVSHKVWRGIGAIPASGFVLRDEFAAFDADRKFPSTQTEPSVEPEGCISGLILQGIQKPGDCASFGTRCTPERPLGATMVSNEGACSAYWRYRRHARSDAS